MALNVKSQYDNIEAALVRSSSIINDPNQIPSSRIGHTKTSLCDKDKIEEAFYQPLKYWTPEIMHRWLNSIHPRYKNIDELLMTDILLGRDMLEIDITQDPHLPVEEKLQRLNNKHYNQFIKLCYNFGIVNKHLLMYKHKLSNLDYKHLKWITTKETINIDVNKVQVPKLYPTRYYRHYYKMVVDKRRSWDRATEQPVFFFPNQGVYTTRPDIFIMRCELIRVNPHLSDKFTPLRKLEFGYYNLDKIQEFDMRTPPISNDTPDIDIESRAMFLSAMKNVVPTLNLLVKLEFFQKHWKKTIDNLPRRENFGIKRMWNENLIEIMGLAEQASRHSNVRSIHNKTITDKLYLLKNVIKTAFNNGYISLSKYLNMTQDIEEFIRLNLALCKTISKS